MITQSNSTLLAELNKLYHQGLTDYYMDPLILVDSNQNPVGLVKDGDSIIFCCKRGEREIQLTRSFVDPSFKEFATRRLNDLNFVSLTLYHEMFKQMEVAVAFPQKQRLSDTLGDIISQNNLRQLRVAESEKFAHVTYFLNGSNNQIMPGEEHACIPSLRGVPFDEVPALKSEEVAEALVNGLQNGKHDLIVSNFANGDMIGHLENQEAKIKCAEAVDRQLGKVLSAAAASGYVTIITADHGILESAFNSDGNVNLSHTTNLVPFILVDPDKNHVEKIRLRNAGTLADVAPTALEIMGLSIPAAMTGQSLCESGCNSQITRKVLLIVLDGWGLGKADKTNPIFMANTPVWDQLLSSCPMAQLEASGKAVGLLDWKAGNSEAGHQTIGAGRMVIQDDARIEMAIQDKSFNENPVFVKVLEETKARNGALHLIALLSERSSHGSLSYPVALLRLAKEKQLEKVFVHAILDGRSTKVRSAARYLEILQNEMDSLSLGEFATGIGRGLVLDRGGDYRKTKKAYDAIVYGIGRKVPLEE